ncbi:MAG: histidine phosphatase family protein [Mobilitalea sp.]
MIRLVLIRHFATLGNLQKRYIGTTDEPLCEEGRKVVEKISYPEVDTVLASPLLRCKETAGLIYPNIRPIICDNFRECDFGEFENKNYMELADNPRYQDWLDSNGTLPFPQGEAVEEFKERTLLEFQKRMELYNAKDDISVALVVHGGTIMSILEKYAYPKEEFYHWQVKNGCGYSADYEEKEGRIINICNIH